MANDLVKRKEEMDARLPGLGPNKAGEANRVISSSSKLCPFCAK